MSKRDDVSPLCLVSAFDPLRTEAGGLRPCPSPLGEVSAFADGGVWRRVAIPLRRFAPPPPRGRSGGRLTFTCEPLQTLGSRDYRQPLIRKLRPGSVLAVAFVATATVANPTHAPSPRAVLAKHDPERRIPHTIIDQLGTIRHGNAKYAIYYLNFTSPVSHHGQQRIAVIKNGTTFVGSHQCTLGREQGKIVVSADRVTVTLFGKTSAIRFGGRGPIVDKFFCGESSGWVQSV